MKKFQRTGALAPFVLLSGIVASTAAAQTERGGITGRVTDSAGSVLPGTVIKLRNEATGIEQSINTNDDGAYTFTGLNPGSYTLLIDRQGFKREQRQHTVVDVNQVNEQNITLSVGDVSETVEVVAGIQQLQTTTATTGLIVEERAVKELPLVYGNPFTLEVLAPGVLPSGVNPNIHTYDSGTANVSVNGSVLNALEYRLDGAPDNRIRLSAYTPSTEFIDQYKVETSSYDATEGHSAGR